MSAIIVYYLRDAMQGLKRNMKAFLATVVLICISLSLMGSFLLVKQSADGLVSFLETQVKIKVFLTEEADAKAIEQRIQAISNVRTTEIESKEDLMERMKGFFKGKEHLFEAFEEADFPYTILVETKDEKAIDKIASSLTRIEGIDDVVYPQTFAKQVLQWTETLDKYGVGLLAVFLFLSFLTTQMAVSLSIHQRKKEIRIKLLLGAKETHVRNQFLFEGWVMGFVGSVAAAGMVFVMERLVMSRLYEAWPVVFGSISHQMNGLVGMMLFVGSVVGILAAFLSTRGMMKDA